MHRRINCQSNSKSDDCVNYISGLVYNSVWGDRGGTKVAEF